MATTPIEFELPTGLSGWTVNLFPLESDTADASGLSLTEETNAKGRYRADVTGALSGVKRAVIFDSSGTGQTSTLIYLEDDTSVWREISESEAQTISQEKSTADNVQALIGNLDTTVSSRLSTSTWNTFTAGITVLADWLATLAGKSVDSATRNEIQARTAGASYDNTTDSQQALRDRGDSAWVSATGFSTHSANDVTGGTTVATAESNIRGSDSDDLKTLSDAQDTVLGRLGDFGASGLNTVKGFFQALFRSDSDVTAGNVPSEINEAENGGSGGDYDGATESVEALRDKADAAAEHVHVTMGYNVSGDKVQIMVQLFREGEPVDIESEDASASLVVKVREFGAALGSSLFTIDSDSLTSGQSKALQNGVFELTNDTPNFNDNVLYEIDFDLTVSGSTITGSHVVPVWGA